MYDSLARQMARSLVECGIDYFIDLTEEGEAGLKSYLPFLKEAAGKLGVSFIHKRWPVRDFSVPKREFLVQILNDLDQALTDEHRVYVHCYGGIGRTGTVVGCYLVRHGMNGGEALDQIAGWRKGTPDGRRSSPETEAQRRMVLHWRENKK
jgi:protein-tyrosine phosphatase